jgi:murein DD-endopeptidase MepM/ murein hydrolase activator NlpD
LARKRKYILDLHDLQFKQVKLPLKEVLLRSLFWFVASIVVALFYGAVFENLFGSPKEKILSQQIENMKLQISLVDRQLNNSLASIADIRQSDDKRYRPILDMDNLPESYRQAGYGGVDRFTDLTGYQNSDVLIAARTRIEEVKSLANIQKESFMAVAEKAEDWKKEMECQPVISPVDPRYKLGDGFHFRDVHPVNGTARMHWGQDFPVPPGTNVYATGNGKIVEAGWVGSNGFGNIIVIDHGYGLHSTYGHLSKIKVVPGENVKRGDLIGLSGNTGLSSGPHLHYQIDQYGEHKNPVNFFNTDLSDEEYTEMIQAFESKSKFK